MRRTRCIVGRWRLWQGRLTDCAHHGAHFAGLMYIDYIDSSLDVCSWMEGL